MSGIPPVIVLHKVDKGYRSLRDLSLTVAQRRRAGSMRVIWLWQVHNDRLDQPAEVARAGRHHGGPRGPDRRHADTGNCAARGSEGDPGVRRGEAGPNETDGQAGG